MEIHPKQFSQSRNYQYNQNLIIQASSTAYSDQSLIRYRRWSSKFVVTAGCRYSMNDIEPSLTVNFIKIDEDDELVHKQVFKPNFKLKLREDKHYAINIRGVQIVQSYHFWINYSEFDLEEFIRVKQEQYYQRIFAPNNGSQVSLYSVTTPRRLLGRRCYGERLLIKGKFNKVYCEVKFEVQVLTDM